MRSFLALSSVVRVSGFCLLFGFLGGLVLGVGIIS